MKSLFILVAMVAACNSQAQTTSGDASQAPPPNNGIDIILCSNESNRLTVYKQNLETIEFQANAYETVLPVQVTDGDQIRVKIVGGMPVNYTQVQFLTQDDDEERRGWVEESLLTPAGSCQRSPVDEFDIEGMMAPPNPKNIPTEIKKIDHENCCVFPTKQPPQQSISEGMTVFGFPRAHGYRIHAACDIYRKLKDEVVAIDDGEVILPVTEFYGTPMTCELEIRHSNGIIARYGEILCQKIPGTELHAHVKAGQTVGLVGYTGVIQPMLHFELYSGEKSGPLTILANRGFQRRGDLVNPTNLLLEWQKRSFKPAANPAAPATPATVEEAPAAGPGIAPAPAQAAPAASPVSSPAPEVKAPEPLPAAAALAVPHA